MTHEEFSNRYHGISYTSNYIIGFPYKHDVYALFIHNVNADFIKSITCIDKDSKTGTASLRFRPTNAIKRQLIAMGAVKQGYTDEQLYAWALDFAKGNRGSMFERIQTEAAGQHWTKDAVPFTEAGDVVINGIAYQIKYNKATFTTEQALKSLMMKA